MNDDDRDDGVVFLVKFRTPPDGTWSFLTNMNNGYIFMRLSGGRRSGLSNEVKQYRNLKQGSIYNKN